MYISLYLNQLSSHLILRKSFHYQNKRETEAAEKRVIETFTKTEFAQYYPIVTPDEARASETAEVISETVD